VPGPLWEIETCRGAVCELAGVKEAAARPAIATSRANMRMAVVIFGNLIKLDLEKDLALSR
jgi:hypothetical protein